MCATDYQRIQKAAAVSNLSTNREDNRVGLAVAVSAQSSFLQTTFRDLQMS